MDPEKLAALRSRKGRFLTLFYALLLSNPLLRYVEGPNPSQEPGALAGVLGIVVICLALWFVIMTFQMARALEFGVPACIGLVLLSFLPLINLIVILVIVKAYKKAASVETNFFMFDTNTLPIESADSVA